MLTPYPGISEKKYRPDIDGLRALAVCMVVIFHGFPSLLPGGYIGVDIFFVISGYLITGIIFSDLQLGKFNFAQFYAKRIRRIFPSLLAVLIFCLVFGWLSLLPEEYRQLGKAVASGAGFSSNFTLLEESGYFDIDAQQKILIHLWSLAIEEQFYIFWPLILWAVFKLKRSILLCTICLCLLSFIFDLNLLGRNHVAAFYNPFARIWELLIGSSLFLASQLKFVSKTEMTGLQLNLLSFLGATLIFLGPIFLRPSSSFPGFWALLPTVGAALLIASGPHALLNSKILSNKLIVYIGLISFPLYLWHWPLLTFLRIIEGDNVSILLRLLALVLSTLFACLSYAILEKPIRWRFGQSKRLLVGLMLAMPAVGLSGFYVYKSDGFRARNSAAENFRKNNWSYGWKNEGCTAEYLKISTDCNANSSMPPEVLVVGDSHTQGLYLSLAKLMPDVSIMRYGSYAPFFNAEVTIDSIHRHEAAEINRILNFAINSKSIKTIIIGFRAVINISGSNFSNNLEKDAIPRVLRDASQTDIRDSSKVYQALVRTTFEKLSRSKKKIIFVIDNPELDFNPIECIAIRPIHLTKRDTKNPCAISRVAYEKRSQEYISITRALLSAYPEILHLDTPKILCDDSWCWAKMGDELLYMDDNHLSIQGSDLLATELKHYINQ